MIQVYVWNPRGLNVGHAAAQIGPASDRDGYVSWWPTNEERWKESQAGAAPTFEDDVRSEGDRQPDSVRTVARLDEGAAKRWWQALRARRGQYSGMNQNCAWAVIMALKAGGADDRIQWDGSLARYNIPLAIATPHLCAAAVITIIGQRAAGTASNIVERTFGVQSPAVNDFLQSSKPTVAFADHCTTIWTPADADRYAAAIRWNAGASGQW